MVAIVDYGLSNVRAVFSKIKRIHANTIFANNPDQILAAKKLILPGVRAFAEIMKNGYDLEIIKKAKSILDVPIIALCGAGSVNDLYQVISDCKISAAAAGSLFVFHGRLDAVLISYPSSEELIEYEVFNC